MANIFNTIFSKVKSIFTKNEKLVEEEVQPKVEEKIIETKSETVPDVVEVEDYIVQETQDRREVLEEIEEYLSRDDKRKICEIAVHCTATKPNVNVTVKMIDGWHKARGFRKQKISGHYCGYHFVVALDGTIMKGRDIQEIGAHVSGFNSRSIGVCYVGGIDENGKGVDTRTEEQKESLIWLISHLKNDLGISVVKGHRDYSPDKNGDGVITKDEWIKACPSFDAIPEYKDI